MRLPHRLQRQKVKSQGHGAGAYCGGHLAAQLVCSDMVAITSSSAVAERLRDALCPSVLSFNSVIPRAHSFIIVT